MFGEKASGAGSGGEARQSMSRPLNQKKKDKVQIYRFPLFNGSHVEIYLCGYLEDMELGDMAAMANEVKGTLRRAST